VRDVDGFAGVFHLEADVSEIKGLSDRIAICGRATSRAGARGLFDRAFYKQFGIANPDRMQGVRRSLSRALASIPRARIDPVRSHRSRAHTSIPH